MNFTIWCHSWERYIDVYIIVSLVIMVCIEMRKEDEKNASFVSNLYPRISAWIHTFLQVTIPLYLYCHTMTNTSSSILIPPNSNLIYIKQAYGTIRFKPPSLVAIICLFPHLHCTHCVRFHHISYRSTNIHALCQLFALSCFLP